VHWVVVNAMPIVPSMIFMPKGKIVAVCDAVTSTSGSVADERGSFSTIPATCPALIQVVRTSGCQRRGSVVYQ